MGIKMSEIMAVLEKVNAENLYVVKVPGTGQELSFRPLTVGMRKSLAKFALGDMSDSSMNEFQMAKMAMLKSLSVTNFDENDITEIDFISMLAQVRNSNSIEDLTLNITCMNNSCGKRFAHVVNLDDIVDRCSKFDFLQKKVEVVDKHNVKYVFTLGYPSMMDVLAMRKFGETTDPEIYRLTYPYIYLKMISVDGNDIDDFRQSDIHRRIAVIEGLNDSVLYKGGDNSVYRMVYEKFGDDNVFKVYGDVRCPFCQYEMGGVVTTDSFFII